MANNETSLNENLIAAGLNPNSPQTTYVDFAEAIARNQREQANHEQALKLAKERVAQAKYQTRNETGASAAGLNPLLVDTMTPQEARAYLKVISDAKGLEIDQAAINEWVASLPARVDRNTVEAFATRFARASTRSGQPAKFEKKDRIMIPEGTTAEALGLESDVDPKFGHVPEDGMYQVVYDNQGVIKKFIPGGKDTPLKDMGLTPGEKAVDIDFGKEYSDWVAQGGVTKIEQNLKKLAVVTDALSKRDDLTGPWISTLPDAVRKRVVAESQNMQDVVSEVVQQNLKLILGAQFTQNEAFALIQRAYNIALEEPENEKRVNRVIDQLKKAASIKAEAAHYFQQHGTLKGWDGYARIKATLDPDEIGPVVTETPKDEKKPVKAEKPEPTESKMPSLSEIKAERERRKAEKK